MAKEFLDSSARINYTKEQIVSQGFKKAIRWSYLTAAGFLGLSQVLTGCSQKEAMSVIAAPEPTRATATLTPDNQPTATATISLTPGIGGAEPIPTFPAGHPREKENPSIDEANRKADEAAAKATVQAGRKIPPEGTQIPKEAPTPPEVIKNPAKCVFIKDPKICALGQPITKPGKELQILGVEYNDIQNTPITTRAGYFSVARDNKTQEIVGIYIDLADGSKLHINSDDLKIENTKSRDVENDEVVARVGKSGHVSFSTAANINFQTGEVTTPQSFFQDNFPEEVIRKSKKLVQASTGTKVVITKKFED